MPRYPILTDGFKPANVPNTRQQLLEFFLHMLRYWNPFRTDEFKTKEQLKDFSKQHDTKGDKLLSKEELKKAFDDLQSRNPGFRAWIEMGKADADGDQQISQQEMEALLDYAVGIKYLVKA